MPPLSPDDVTTGWLNECLHKRGIAADIARFESRRIGTGMMGSTYRLALTYASAPEGAPASVVMKIAGEGELSQKLGRTGYGFHGKPGFFGSEILFYQAVAERTSIRVPACYFAWISEDGGRFVLMLEDVAPARSGDELEGCSLAEAKMALANLAGLHAPMWNSEEFEAENGPLRRTTADDAARFARHMAKAVKTFGEVHTGRFSGESTALIGAFGAKFERWFLAAERATALTHNDYRLDNLMFTQGPSPECVAVDWQSFTVSHPGFDVGLMLVASIPTELRRAHESEILRAYHDRLIALGVPNYTFEACCEDLRYGAFLGVKNAVIGLRAVTMTDRGLTMFDTKLRRACATVLDHDSLALLA